MSEFWTPPTIGQKFAEFHEKNPHVCVELVKLARRGKARGQTRLGMGMLTEVLRWNYVMSTDDPYSDFKLNNTYRAEYARLIMAEYPDLAGIFKIRKLKAPR